MHSKESWRQLTECVCRHKNLEPSSQRNNDNTLSDLLTATQQSTEKKGRKLPQQHKPEEDEGDDRTGGGEAHPRSLKHVRTCKGK